eukprot:14376818-Heterocapsa_arctica.AAC.1
MERKRKEDGKEVEFVAALQEVVEDYGRKCCMAVKEQCSSQTHKALQKVEPRWTETDDRSQQRRRRTERSRANGRATMGGGEGQDQLAGGM